MSLYRLSDLQSLELGSAAFTKGFETPACELRHLTRLELNDCGILPQWLGDIIKWLPNLEVLSLVRPVHPSDWPVQYPCGNLDFTNASTTLRSASSLARANYQIGYAKLKSKAPRWTRETVACLPECIGCACLFYFQAYPILGQ